MKRRYTVLALVAGVHATAGLIVLAQSQSASQAAAGANKGGTATPQGTGAGPFVTLFQSKSLEPDIQHGAVIAAQGTAAGAPACAQCHAYDGVSDASGAFPRIAGQSRSYLAEQLRDFASGARNNAFMTPIAKALSAQDMADVAAYYASTNAPTLPLKPPQASLLKAGETLATVGNAQRQIQACNNCHGPGGAAHLPEHVAAPIGADEAGQALKDGPKGALLIASIAVGLLFIGWLLFYFLLFMPRGPIG